VNDFYCRDEDKNGLECASKALGATQCQTCKLLERGKELERIRNIKPSVLPHYPDLDFCKCNDCLSGETALQRQLDHKFYKDADAFRNGVKMETLKKAAQKYPEPFNPASWTIEELAKHAMAENYDQQNYIYGMYERLTTLERENAELESLYNKRCTEIEGLMQKLEGQAAQIERQKLIVTEIYGQIQNADIDSKTNDWVENGENAIQLVTKIENIIIEHWNYFNNKKGQFIDERI
jgi:hypothetical protein